MSHIAFTFIAATALLATACAEGDFITDETAAELGAEVEVAETEQALQTCDELLVQYCWGFETGLQGEGRCADPQRQLVPGVCIIVDQSTPCAFQGEYRNSI